MKEKVIRICKFCGKPFETNNKSQRYCCKPCYHMGQCMSSRKQYKENREKIIGSPIRICAFCGKEFEVSKKHRKYCSEECRRKAFNQRNRIKYHNKKDSRHE